MMSETTKKIIALIGLILLGMILIIDGISKIK
jgi:uncharacterized membrane protein YphA (DoxX/SURF4 family)